jgi:hypothetical protein
VIAVWLKVLRIAVLGYWLGSELVINSTYRLVAFGDRLPFDERTRLMEHVMDVDQHVRYALVLQAALGTALAALYGLVPGGARRWPGACWRQARCGSPSSRPCTGCGTPLRVPRWPPSTAACATG